MFDPISSFQAILTKKYFSTYDNEKPNFPGSKSEYVSEPEFLDPDQMDGIPVYRAMNRDGYFINESQDPKVNTLQYNTLINLYFEEIDMLKMLSLSSYMYHVPRMMMNNSPI